jgi:hypothetical protein
LLSRFLSVLIRWSQQKRVLGQESTLPLVWVAAGTMFVVAVLESAVTRPTRKAAATRTAMAMATSAKRIAVAADRSLSMLAGTVVTLMWLSSHLGCLGGGP